MSEVTYYEFIDLLSKEFNLKTHKEYTLKLPAARKVVKYFTTSVANEVRIFDGEKEHPYMIEKGRNEDVFKKGVELRRFGRKSICEILAEIPVKLRTESCKICEGGGWYSKGTRYYYKENYIEV